jgi:hypothetical protein
LLKKHGVKIEDDYHSDEHHEPTPSEHYGSKAWGLDVPRNPKTDRGIIFTDNVNSRYVEKYAQILSPQDIH